MSSSFDTYRETEDGMYPFSQGGTQGLNLPTFAADIFNSGQIWHNVNNILVGTNVAAATYDTTTSGNDSDFLFAGGFGFTIPLTATILSIKAQVSAGLSNPDGGVYAQIWFGEGAISNAIQIGISAVPTIYTIDKTLAEWGIASLTPEQANQSNQDTPDFGIGFYVPDPKGGDFETYSVFYTKLSITYA